MFFVSMMLIFRSGGAFSSFEQVGIRQELSIISLLSNYQTITRILEDEKSCQVPCFFMRLGRGSFSQSIDYLSVMKNLACQLVQKTHAWHPIFQKLHAVTRLFRNPTPATDCETRLKIFCRYG